MDGRPDYPTHVVARERIEQQLRAWHAEHASWETTLQREPTDESEWRLLMIRRFDDDPPGQMWFTHYPIGSALISYMGRDGTLWGVLSTVQGMLTQMQREIGVMHHGAHSAT
jgi:hypothetical protein